MKKLYFLFLWIFIFSSEVLAYNVKAQILQYYKDPQTGINSENIIAQFHGPVSGPDWEQNILLAGKIWKLRLVIYSSETEIDVNKKASVSAILRWPEEMPQYFDEMTSTNTIIDVGLNQEVRQVWAFGGYNLYVLKFVIE